MNHSQLVLDQVRAMGLLLRDARLARDINPRDLETELRTTYRHLLAIEEGQMRLFYSDSFFCDLFTRYAVQLGFSAEQAHDMRLALSGEGPLVSLPKEPEAEAEAEAETEQAPQIDEAPAAYGAPETRDASETHGTPVTHDPPETQQGPEPEASLLSPSPSAAQASPLADGESSSLASSALKQPVSGSNADTEPNPARTLATDTSQSLGSLWFWGAIAMGLVLAVVILTLEPSAESPAPVAVEKALSKLQDKEKAAASPELSATPVETPVTNASQAATPSSSTAATEAPTQVESPVPQVAEPPKERRISDSILVSAFEAPAGFATGSAMAIRFNVKGWVWVRELDDSVREFTVQQGQTVRFNELPVFVVVPFPDQLAVSVEEKPVTLRRNDDEKNHARYSRSMLRGLVTNP
ncbi:MAG: hypothetical protein VW440_00045 [Bordetella sp.]